MNIQEAMEFISGTQKFGQNLGLARMECMLEKLGNPQLGIKAIHMAGTNGKGSVAALMAEVLTKQGFRVGLYTSPFIEEFNERIQIDRVNISDDDLAHYTEIVKAVVEDCVRQGLEHPTEFEIITTIMFLYFKDQNPDFCVVEVGLGGDLDSTNVLVPILSVITSISYDHMNVLGNTLTEIAGAKAGIIKKAPVVSYPQLPEAEVVLRKKAEQMGTTIRFVDKKNAEFVSFDPAKGTQTVAYQTPHWSFRSEFRLLGVHQLSNSLLALTALDELDTIYNLHLKRSAITEALRTVHWMGRFEIMNHSPEVIIDGAHNVDGITHLKQTLDFYYPKQKYVLILGILADKETHQMADIIARDAKAVICVTPHSNRASLAKELYDYIISFNDHVSWEDNYRQAFLKALAQCADDDYVIACGSLYMIGDLRRVIREEFNIPYEQ